MKIFISQPMKNRTIEEIKNERKTIEYWINCQWSNSEILDSIFSDEKPENVNQRVYRLGQSIQLLSQADILVLTGDFRNTDGCLIENLVGEKYDIPRYWLDVVTGKFHTL